MAWKQQTDVQQATSIRFGSALFEVGPDTENLTDVGAMRDCVFEETFDKVEVMSDNAGSIELGLRNHFAFLAGNLMEINLQVLEKFYKGVHKYGTGVGTEQTITNEVIVLTDTDFEAFLHRNGDSSECTITQINDAATELVLVRDCDYLITVLGNGYTGIARAFPAAVDEAAADIVPNVGKTYTSGSSGFATILAPGDHIIVAGCTNPANNGVKTVASATNEIITVTDVCVTDDASGSTTITRGGIASDDTVHADYKYTPLASRTLKSGGITAFTAQVARFTNYDAAGKIFRITIWEATPEGGIKIDFPSDMDEDPAMCPIRMKGRLDNGALVSGEQLFEIYDTQHLT